MICLYSVSIHIKWSNKIRIKSYSRLSSGSNVVSISFEHCKLLLIKTREDLTWLVIIYYILRRPLIWYESHSIQEDQFSQVSSYPCSWFLKLIVQSPWELRVWCFKNSKCNWAPVGIWDIPARGWARSNVLRELPGSPPWSLVGESGPGGRLSLEHKVSPDLTLAPVQVSSNYQHYITGSTVQQYTVQQHSYQYWVGKMATMLIQLTPDLLTNKLTCLMSSETTKENT